MKPILKTDAYELTMSSTLIEEGKANQHTVFELFARKLPKGRRFGINAGLGRFLDEYKDWIVTPGVIAFLENTGHITPIMKTWLTEKLDSKLFTGSIKAYREGDLYWGYSPIVQVEGPLVECILLETLLLSIYNHDTAVASAAARMVIAANGRPVIEMGSRRTDDEAAISAARAAFIAGFDYTSNLAARERYGIPTTGTAAHAFTLAHDSEIEAFRAQMKTWGVNTTLLVDTYDTPQGIRNAVQVANEYGHAGPKAIRIDSGDLLVETHEARKLLDLLGAFDTRITVSSDLDEYLMTELQAAPIDGYGAGTRVVTGSGHPTAGMVYKLVEIDGKPVAKKSHDKISIGGRKTPYRRGEREYYTLNGELKGTPLLETVIENGEIILERGINDVRAFTLETIHGMPDDWKNVSDGEAAMISELE